MAYYVTVIKWHTAVIVSKWSIIFTFIFINFTIKFYIYDYIIIILLYILLFVGILFFIAVTKTYAWTENSFLQICLMARDHRSKNFDHLIY